MPFPRFLSSRRKKESEVAAIAAESLDESIEGCCWLRSLCFEDIAKSVSLSGAFEDFLQERRMNFDFYKEIRSFRKQSETLSGYSDAESLVEQRTEALRLYEKYISPSAVPPVSLPCSLSHEIIKGICTESPSVDPNVFIQAEHLLQATLSNEEFSEFLRSPEYARYLLQGTGPISIRDVVSNEALLSQFTEFLEAEGDKDLLSFWMIVNHFHEQSSPLQGDALVIYEKYVSMQASKPLGLSHAIRSEIEEQICVQGGRSLDPHLFDPALRIVVSNLSSKYLKPFLQSPLFQNYRSELKSTISSSSSNSNSPSKPAWSLTGRRSASITSLASSCSDISTQNTLLAMSKPGSSRIPKSKSDINGKILHNVDSCPMSLDSSWDPNHIWRSMSSLSSPRSPNIGEIDYLGRYISHFESPPTAAATNKDNNPSSQASTGSSSSTGGGPASPTFVGDPLIRNAGNSKLHRVMRVLGVSGDIPEVQEQLAWHEAEIIVKDILNLTSPNQINCDDYNQT